ncbi:MAG: LysR family transcriptional regulator [Oscillospiraceae bacterium]|nr:LysR family transcriptional regulator [Oscillospiraceae bacterium]MBR7010205.1 LysR family transcriptional regulator [Oscillospiraceae bacterium]
MDFRELNYVLAIAEHQNITKAAEALYVSQPTLSKFLISLENDLGLKLFRRLGNKYVLTYAGERYVDYAARIRRQKADLDVELADILKNDVGVLNLAFARMRCTYMLPGTLPEFRRLYPNVKVNLFEGNSDENDRRLLEGQVDVAFYSRPAVENPMLCYEALDEEELLIICCKDHPIGRFAQQNPGGWPILDPVLLEKETVILMQPEQRTRQITDALFQERKLRFADTVYTSNLPAIMGLVARGYGVSFLFEPHLRHRAERFELDCYSIGQGRVVSEFVAAYRKSSYLSSYARDYIKLVQELHRNDSGTRPAS